MGKMQIPQKIRTEDFSSDDQEIAGKIAGVVNQPLEDIYNIINGNIDFANLNRQLSSIDVIMDSAGKVLNAGQIKITLKTRVAGLNVLSAVNLLNPGVYPTSAPFVSWSTNANILTILNITGLQPSSQYRLTLEIIG
jgi:hypothetical protein